MGVYNEVISVHSMLATCLWMTDMYDNDITSEKKKPDRKMLKNSANYVYD